MPENADALRETLSRDFFPGTETKVPSEIVRYWNADGEPVPFTRFEILSQHAAMIANGVERTQRGEHHGIANTLVLPSNGANASEDIDLYPQAFALLANGESLSKMIGAKAGSVRASGFGGIGGR